MINRTMKIAVLAVCAALMQPQYHAASDLQRIAIFESLYAREAAETEVEHLVEADATAPSDEASAPEADAGGQASQPTVRKLVEQIAALPDQEKFTQVVAWIQAGNPQISTIENLIGALQVLQMEPGLIDKIVGVYAGKQGEKLSEASLGRVLELLSDASLAEADMAANWGAQAIQMYVASHQVPFSEFYALVKSFGKRGGDNDIRDLTLIVDYVKGQGGKLQLDEVERLISLMNNRAIKVQAAGEVLNTYMIGNAGDLLKPEFRERLAKLQTYWPLGAGLAKISTLNPDQQAVLFYSEWNFFRDLFFTTGSVVNAIKASLAPEQWRAVRDLFIERNQHRLKPGQIDKLNRAFQ